MSAQLIPKDDTERSDYETYLKRFRRILKAVPDEEYKRVTYADIQNMEAHKNWPSCEWFGATIPDFDGVLLMATLPDRSINNRDFYIQIDNVLFLAGRRTFKNESPHFMDLFDTVMATDALKNTEPYSPEELGYEIVEFLEDYRDWGFTDENWNKA